MKVTEHISSTRLQDHAACSNHILLGCLADACGHIPICLLVIQRHRSMLDREHCQVFQRPAGAIGSGKTVHEPNAGCAWKENRRPTPDQEYRR
jgi:hypothetical protein